MFFVVACCFNVSAEDGSGTPPLVKIGDVRANPSRYAGKLVQLTGRVDQAVSVFSIGYFTLKDSGGEIVVIPSKTFPIAGESLTVRGRINPVFVVGEKSVVALVEEKK